MPPVAEIACFETGSKFSLSGSWKDTVFFLPNCLTLGPCSAVSQWSGADDPAASSSGFSLDVTVAFLGRPRTGRDDGAVTCIASCVETTSLETSVVAFFAGLPRANFGCAVVLSCVVDSTAFLGRPRAGFLAGGSCSSSSLSSALVFLFVAVLLVSDVVVLEVVGFGFALALAAAVMIFAGFRAGSLPLVVARERVILLGGDSIVAGWFQGCIAQDFRRAHFIELSNLGAFAWPKIHPMI